MTLVSKNVYINKLDDLVNKYNNAYHRAIKTKPIDVKSSTYIDSCKKINNKDPKFKIGNILRISKYIKYSWKRLKILCRGPMLLMILMDNKLLELFTKKNCKKQIKMSLE